MKQKNTCKEVRLLTEEAVCDLVALVRQPLHDKFTFPIWFILRFREPQLRAGILCLF